MLVRLRKNGQITLPAVICKALNLKEGDFLEVQARDGIIRLTPKKLVDKSQA
jgi:AbrB family looped-hinge helix DNA binding protein